MGAIHVKYTAVTRRVGGWWAVSVPEIKGVHTQARRLSQVEAMVRDAIALVLDVDPDSFDIEVRPEVPAEAARAVAARRAARQAEETAEHATAAAVVAMLADGYTVRDAGALLEISPQRVSQINAAYKDSGRLKVSHAARASARRAADAVRASDDMNDTARVSA